MGKMQGNGKVRLIAKMGRYAEDANSLRARGLLMSAGVTETSDRTTVLGQATRFSDGSSTGLSNYYIEFDVTPDITESGSASYSESGNVVAPGSVLTYKGSPARTFTISAKLVARNLYEARKVVAQIHLLKSWRMPETYGGGFAAGVPTLLYLQGYGKMFKDIPTVMTDLSIEFSSEFDALSIGQETQYFEDITTKTGKNSDGVMETKKTSSFRGVEISSAVPIIVPVSITLKEARAMGLESENGPGLDGFASFDILQYRTGTLPNW